MPEADLIEIFVAPLERLGIRSATHGIGGLRVRVAPPEYVILRKLEFYREGGSEKHLRDIRSMLALSPERLDRSALSEWIRRLGLEAQWSEVEAEES